MHDIQVIVVGLGAMGAATLYQLARRGVRALGIDCHAPPHSRGSSHGQTRITRRALGEGPEYAPLVKASHRTWRELETRVPGKLFVQSGVLIVAPTAIPAGAHGQKDFLGRTFATAQQHGIAHEALDAAALRARFPMFTGITEDTVGYFEPEAGYVFPDRCIAAQLELARRDGAAVQAHTRVTAVRERAGGIEVDTTVGTLRAERAVIAAGPWTGPLLGSPFDELLVVRRQLLHWFGTDPGSEAALAGMPAFVRLHGARGEKVFYGFPPVEEERAIKVATEQYETWTTAETVVRTVDPRDAAAMYAEHVAPCLDGIRASMVRESVACVYTMTPGHHFLIDEHPEMPRVLVVSACSGHGFT